MKWFISLALTLFVQSVLVAEDVPRPASGAVDIPAVDALQFGGIFLTNEVRAEADYKDKLVAVAGTVGRVIRPRTGGGQDGKNAYLLEMNVQESTEAVLCLQFYFDRSEQATLMELRAGQAITIKGRCTGTSIYTGIRNEKRKDWIDVQLTECKIIKVKS